MALKRDIRGMSHTYPDYFVVGREKVRECTRAVKAEDPASLDEEAAAELGHDAVVAPLTFSSIFALLVQQARVDIHSVEERFGADIVVTRNVCTDHDGELVMEAYTTLMGQQGENSARIDFG
jgi:hypothetical protein